MLNRRTGPSGSFESRTLTSLGEIATSTQVWSDPWLKLLWRQHMASYTEWSFRVCWGEEEIGLQAPLAAPEGCVARGTGLLESSQTPTQPRYRLGSYELIAMVWIPAVRPS